MDHPSFRPKLQHLLTFSTPTSIYTSRNAFRNALRAQANLAGKIISGDHFTGEYMVQNRTYTTEQIAVVARELREAAGAEEERFTASQVLDLLDGEIRSLRQRGFTDEHITGLFAGFDIELKKNQIERRSRAPGNLLRRVFWDRVNGGQQQRDLPIRPQSPRP